MTFDTLAITDDEMIVVTCPRALIHLLPSNVRG